MSCCFLLYWINKKSIKKVKQIDNTIKSRKVVLFMKIEIYFKVFLHIKSITSDKILIQSLQNIMYCLLSIFFHLLILPYVTNEQSIRLTKTSTSRKIDNQIFWLMELFYAFPIFLLLLLFLSNIHSIEWIKSFYI